MYPWHDYSQTLKDLAAEAATSPGWADYAAFCLESERGLRRQAFTILERFIVSLEPAPFTERRRFVSWLMWKRNGKEGEHIPIPHPLYVRIVKPTLLEWTEVEPGCSEPHRWLGGREHLRRAIELQPDDELARRKLINTILGWVSMSTHELPVGYLGAPDDDLAALKEVESVLQRISSDEERGRYLSQTRKQRALIERYLLTRETMHCVEAMKKPKE